jgi:electron transfer flavoprotein beta subunit
MNIVVCIKDVPDATADRQFDSDNTVDRVNADGLFSELDECAVEQALQIQEERVEGDDVTITALSVGPETLGTGAVKELIALKCYLA